jgi:hypothetical protein
MTPDECKDLVGRYIRAQRMQEAPKPAYWVLYATNSRAISKSDTMRPVWKNLEISEVEDSILELENALDIMFQTSPARFFILILKTDPKQTNDALQFSFENPGYTNQQQSRSSIGSTGTGNANDQILMLHQTIFQMKMDAQEEKHERQLDEIRAEIGTTKKSGFFDKIAGLVEKNPMVQNLAIGMASKLLGIDVSALSGTGEIAGSDTDEEEGEEPEYTEEQKEKAIKITKAANMLKTVFPDADDVMMEFAMYAKNNPQLAQNMRNMIKTS